MADFMCCTTALVIIGYVSSRDAAGEDIAAILVISTAAWRGIGGEVANPQEAITEVGKKIDVQTGVGAFTERWFHLRIIVASCPIIVHGKVGRDQGKGYAAWSVGPIQNRELVECMLANPYAAHSRRFMIAR